MNALVIYRYQPAGAEQSDEIMIRSEEMDVNTNRLETNPHMVGDTVILEPEEGEEEAIKKFGSGPKMYMVSKLVHTLTQTAGHSPRLSVAVSVSDPNS